MTKTKSIYTTLLLTGILSVAGCAGAGQKVGHQLVAQPDSVSLRLASAVDRASTALQTLASVEQARKPLATVSPVKDAPRELMRSISVDWTGPIEPLAQRIADRAGYTFEIIGMQPPIPVVININAVEKPVIDVLRDIGLQSGNRADIIVDADRKIIEVSYASIHGEY